MTDSYGDPQQFGGQGDGKREGGRDGARRRGPGNREGGGFRIRLSDNEMRSARALQEAFNLRSTVAVLGFAVRSLGQMLEDGQLDALVEQQRSQAPRSGGRRSEGGGRTASRSEAPRGNRPDPFARPSKPQAAPEEVSEPDQADEAPASVDDAAASEGSAADASSEASADTTDGQD
ncbi:MAG: hypothetical protein VKK03_05630 [Synechococcus sp.]|nr:hypothetical protein [Synechococcus sp.]